MQERDEIGFTQNGLLLIAPPEVRVTLFESIDPKAESIPETACRTVGDLCGHFYAELPANEKGYRFVSEGEGYYTRKQKLYYPQEKAERLNVVDADPQKKRGDGFEPDTYFSDTDEMRQKLLPENPLWCTRYPEIYQTPTLHDHPREECTFTTQAEMDAFFRSCAEKCEKLYRYSLCTLPTEDHFELPLFVFTQTDLSDCSDYWEAAKKLAKNCKPNILYRAHIHGKEPAGCDGALSVAALMSGAFGEQITEKLNLVMIPRVNPDGAKRFTRENANDGIDLNRDSIRLRSVEARAVNDAYHAFLPAAFLDGHEYFHSNCEQTGKYIDVLLGVGGGVNTGRELSEAGVRITRSMIGALNREGIRASYYYADDYAGTIRGQLMVNTANFASARGFYSLRGCLSLLIESRGISLGRQAYARRVVSHHIALRTLLSYLAAHTDELVQAVAAERERIVSMGRRFDAENRFCLCSGSTLTRCEDTWNPDYDLLSGEMSETEQISHNYYYDVAVRSRPRPTAYVVAKENAAAIWEDVQRHRIAWRELAPGAQVDLRGYEGEAAAQEGRDGFVIEEATLREEERVTFPNGALVFPTDQIAGTLLMYLFEPDVNDTQRQGSSFPQRGILTMDQIYRYEHDLEEDGNVRCFFS